MVDTTSVELWVYNLVQCGGNIGFLVSNLNEQCTLMLPRLGEGQFGRYFCVCQMVFCVLWDDYFHLGLID